MSFLHGYLLAGLVLAGIPILLHLIMRQKPKRLPFPAFRFLKQKQRINQRRLQLQHLLLLALRILVIAALCFALARPRLYSSRLGAGGNRPVQAVLIIDTSPSMGYTVAGRTHLKDACDKARSLLDQMNPNSRVAVIGSGDDQNESLQGLAEARDRLSSLETETRPSATSLNAALQQAASLLKSDDDIPRLIYIFSDRTRACWDLSLLPPTLPDGVQGIFVDVGLDDPRDLAIERVEVVPPVVAPGARYEVRVQIRATPGGHDREISCSSDNDPSAPPDRQPIKLAKDELADLIVFERTAPITKRDTVQQLTIKLPDDSLDFNNKVSVSFVVRGSRKLLTLVQDDVTTARVWQAVHEAVGAFACETKTLDEAATLTGEQLAAYPVICLFQTPSPGVAWWKKLTQRVEAGAGLAIVPGGEEMVADLATFNRDGASLLPMPFVKLLTAPTNKVIPWSPFGGSHALMAPFITWSKEADPDFSQPELRPFVRRYWQLGAKAKDAEPIITYQDTARNPSLAERIVGGGKVVQFTSPLDIRLLDPKKPESGQWNNYWQDSSFGLVLVDLVCRHLGGETTIPKLNFLCGQRPQLQITGPRQGPYLLEGPGLSGGEKKVEIPPSGLVDLLQAIKPGAYILLDRNKQAVTGCSLSIRPEESNLDRVDIEEIEKTLGADSVLKVGRTVDLKEALNRHHPPPVDLLPYVMIALLLILCGESVFASKFYRKAAPPEEQKATP